MPSVSVTVGEQIDALRRIAGERAVALIRHELDPNIIRFVEGWPRRFDASRAESLGFRAESNFDDIISIYIEDELGGVVPT
jgi:nucleoside-diphosphate-sugar epimerase